MKSDATPQTGPTPLAPFYSSSSTIWSRLWTIHMDCRRRLRGGAGSHEQTIDFRHIKRRTGTLARLNRPKMFVRSSSRTKNVDNSFSATHVNPFPLCIYEHVIRITACVQGCNNRARQRGQGNELCGTSEDDKHGIGRLIQRHWEIAAVPSLPCRNRFAHVAINDDNSLSGRIVCVNPIRAFIELKALWMCRQLDIRDLAPGRRINNCYCAIAV